MRDRLQSFRCVETLSGRRPSESVPQMFSFFSGTISPWSNSRSTAKPWSYLVVTLGLRVLDLTRSRGVRYNKRWMALENLSAGGVQ
jgi:hypothetical protein